MDFLTFPLTLAISWFSPPIESWISSASSLCSFCKSSSFLGVIAESGSNQVLNRVHNGNLVLSKVNFSRPWSRYHRYRKLKNCFKSFKKPLPIRDKIYGLQSQFYLQCLSPQNGSFLNPTNIINGKTDEHIADYNCHNCNKDNKHNVDCIVVVVDCIPIFSITICPELLT